jgi:hypothetical protein
MVPITVRHISLPNLWSSALGKDALVSAKRSTSFAWTAIIEAAVRTNPTGAKGHVALLMELSRSSVGIVSEG